MNDSPPFELGDLLWVLIISTVSGGILVLAVETGSRFVEQPLIDGPESALIIGGGVGFVLGIVVYLYLWWITRGFLSLKTLFPENVDEDPALPERFYRLDQEIQLLREEREKARAELDRLKTRMLELHDQRFDDRGQRLLDEVNELAESMEGLLDPEPDPQPDPKRLEEITNRLTSTMTERIEDVEANKTKTSIRETVDRLDDFNEEIDTVISDSNRLLEETAELFRTFPVEELPEQAEEIRLQTLAWDRVGKETESLVRQVERIPGVIETLQESLDSDEIRQAVARQLRKANLRVAEDEQARRQPVKQMLKQIRTVEQKARFLITFQEQVVGLVEELEPVGPATQDRRSKPPEEG